MNFPDIHIARQEFVKFLSEKRGILAVLARKLEEIFQKFLNFFEKEREASNTSNKLFLSEGASNRGEASNMGGASIMGRGLDSISIGNILL